jgi:hypothetical protein
MSAVVRQSHARRPSEIEIRPLYEMADFGDALTPDVAELHDRVRDKAAGR